MIYTSYAVAYLWEVWRAFALQDSFIVGHLARQSRTRWLTKGNIAGSRVPSGRRPPNHHRVTRVIYTSYDDQELIVASEPSGYNTLHKQISGFLFRKRGSD